MNFAHHPKYGWKEKGQHRLLNPVPLRASPLRIGLSLQQMGSTYQGPDKQCANSRHNDSPRWHSKIIVAFVSPGGWGFRFCMHKSKNIGGALQNQKHVIWTWTSSIYKILTCNPTWAYTCHPLQIHKIQIIEIHLLYKGIKNWFTKPLKIVSEKNAFCRETSVWSIKISLIHLLIL